jgi:hypothetical protein
VFPGILRLALIDLCSSWFRALAAAILIGAGIVGVAYFAGQAQRTQSLVRAAYEQEGATNFVVEVSGLASLTPTEKDWKHRHRCISRVVPA